MFINYLEDHNVGPDMDRKIRELLTVCFPDQPVFLKQRFYHELPAHRWYIEENNQLIAHTALHEKTVTVDRQDLRIGGIAEVAVHPDARGRGYVRLLLQDAHDWLTSHGYVFSMLFGKTKVYASSGYEPLNRTFRYLDPKTNEWITGPIDSAMIARLGDTSWPEGLINLNGPMF